MVPVATAAWGTDKPTCPSSVCANSSFIKCENTRVPKEHSWDLLHFSLWTQDVGRNVVLSGIPEGLNTSSLGDNRVRQSSPNSTFSPAEINSLPGQIPIGGLYLLPHCPSGSITGHGNAARWLLFLSSFRGKTRLIKGGRRPLPLYNGTGPSRRAWHLTELKERCNSTWM